MEEVHRAGYVRRGMELPCLLQCVILPGSPNTEFAEEYEEDMTSCRDVVGKRSILIGSSENHG